MGKCHSRVGEICGSDFQLSASDHPRELLPLSTSRLISTPPRPLGTSWFPQMSSFIAHGTHFHTKPTMLASSVKEEPSTHR
jgi:hypothetical protein